MSRQATAPASGRDPIATIAAQATGRLPELLGLRYQRMRASPFAFLRGAAAVMAADLAEGGLAGPFVQLCGDAHLANFGCYASPEGNPVFDVNDFDETLPGPFHWDVRRLAASLVVSGREHGLPVREQRALAMRCARRYRHHMKHLAALSPLDAWHSTIDMRAAIGTIDHHKLRRRLERRLRAALQTSRAQYDLVGDGGRRLVIHDSTGDARTRHMASTEPIIDAAFAAYPATLQPQLADLVGRYRLVDRAMKVVGIGSVGTFCAIGLFASVAGAPLLLQLKEAQASVLENATAAPPRSAPQGERVVTGQRRLQAQSDIFLGWTPAPVDGRAFYVRRLKDSRLAGVAVAIEGDMLGFSASLCGRTLARAHGRAGEAATLAAAMSVGRRFDEEIVNFACAYADQTERDHAAFCAALDAGVLG